MRAYQMLILAGLTAVACGDDGEGGGGGGGGGTSAIDEKKLSELKGTELKQFCDWLIKLEKDAVSDEQYCTYDAATYAEDSEECEQLRDECIADFEGEEPGDCDDFPATPKCDNTVAEVKDCINDIYKADNAAAKSASCDAIEDVQETALPASCKKVTPECFEVELEAEGRSGSLTSTSARSLLRR